MGGFNKILSFVLGLIVVVVFLVVLSARFNLTRTLIPLHDAASISPSPTPGEQKGFFASLFGAKNTPTPTLTQQPTEVQTTYPTITPYVTQSVVPSGGVTQIPKTGSGTELLPALIAALGSGIYLRKKS